MLDKVALTDFDWSYFAGKTIGDRTIVCGFTNDPIPCLVSRSMGKRAWILLVRIRIILELWTTNRSG